jgi:hypothetical protein
MLMNCKFQIIAISWTLVLSSVIYGSYRLGASSCSSKDMPEQAISQVTPSPSTPPPTPTIVPEKEPELIFNNHNVAAVTNKPTAPTLFTLSKSRTITSIETYHWNNAQGADETGTISLESGSGEAYGPWETTGRSGQGGVPNAYWTATPNITLEPGTYQVIDSSLDTWSQNGGSEGQGMVKVYAK